MNLATVRVAMILPIVLVALFVLRVFCMPQHRSFELTRQYVPS